MDAGTVFDWMLNALTEELIGCRPVVIGCDFNAWAVKWGSRCSNARGHSPLEALAKMYVRLSEELLLFAKSAGNPLSMASADGALRHSKGRERSSGGENEGVQLGFFFVEAFRIFNGAMELNTIELTDA